MLFRSTAVMSLLEGHANVVMDGVDSSVVSSVKTIRRRFDERGDRRSPLDRMLRRLLGMDAKMAQYRDGQRFVAAAVAELVAAREKARLVETKAGLQAWVAAHGATQAVSGARSPASGRSGTRLGKRRTPALYRWSG